MRFSQSLKLNHEFRRLYAKGASSAVPQLAAYCRRNKRGINRIGITAGTKLGHAVVRNRLRRRVREIYRTNEERFEPGWDIVFVIRARADGTPYGELERRMLSLCRRLGLLKAEGGADQ